MKTSSPFKSEKNTHCFNQMSNSYKNRWWFTGFEKVTPFPIRFVRAPHDFGQVA